MNSVSWFIYFIGLVETLHKSVIGMMAVCGFVAFITLIVRFAMSLDDYVPVPDGMVKVSNYSIFGFLVALTLYVVVPNQRTMILMAASEVGEKVLTSERVTGIVDPSINLLKKYIENETTKIGNEINNFKKNATNL